MSQGPMSRVRAGFVALLLLLPTTSLHGQLPAGAHAGPWHNLLNGSAASWRGYKQDSLPAGWAFDAKTGILKHTKGGGDLVSREEYGSFQLELEWRVAPGGNSGVFYHATEATNVIYENAPEMQVLDDARHPDGKNQLTAAGANYGLDGGPAGITKPAGRWNRAQLVVLDANVQHWLNGTRMVSYTLWTPEWKAKV